MKKNIFNIFIDKLLEYPLWVKQIVYLRLFQNMKDNHCEKFIRVNSSRIFATFVPTLTFQGKNELLNKENGLDTNIYNFLSLSSQGYSILEISLNTFLSVEEVAKIFIFCIEQNYIEVPEEVEVFAMAGFIAGKFRVGEYYKINGSITIEQLEAAIVEQRRLQGRMEGEKLFGEILIDLGYITEENVNTLFRLKEDAKKRFILDTAKMQKATLPDEDKRNLEKEIEELKEENKALKKKLMQVLDFVNEKINNKEMSWF